MAIGDRDDMLARLKSELPKRWANYASPKLDAVLGGLADALADLYSFYAYAKDQTRIATASGFMLDLIAWDFLGGRLLRRNSQQDNSFRAAILKEIFRPRATRSSMTLALSDLTGKAPIIFEPANPLDTGAWNGLMGWSCAGRWGSLQHPFECWIDAQRPTGQGIPGVEGYGGSAGGWGQGRSEWASLSMMSGPVTDDDIYNTIEAIRPAATVCWTRISDDLPPVFLQPSYSFLDSPAGDRLVLDDESGIIVSGPPYDQPFTAPGTAPTPADTSHLWFDDKKQSGQIAAVWPF